MHLKCFHNLTSVIYLINLELDNLLFYFVHTKFDIYVYITITGGYLCWWTISPEGIIHPVISILALTWFLLLSLGLYLCWWTISPEDIIHPVISILALTWFLLLSLGRYLCWWTISPEGIIHPVISILALTWLLDIFLLKFTVTK
jgi:hypothetical protein